MKVHKLTAGDGYTYLTRQVAAQDVTHRGRSGLGTYYTEKGESPGVWMGRGASAGLGGVLDFRLDEAVTEDQMRLLFGEGRHPNAREVERAARAAGKSEREIDRASMLGSPYRIYEDTNEFRTRCAEAFAASNSTAGLPRDWPVEASERAAIRTQIAREMFAETYGRGPVDARELSGHVARISRQATTAVAGYDLSFSPVKSVSTLWAVAPRDVSDVIEACHRDAVADTITWIEDNAAFTRRGRNGVEQVNVRGLIAAAFTHRDSRAGDPDLHTHVAVSNKVQALDSTWLALDGRAIYKNNVPASERYNTRLEALLAERLGVSFANREPTGRSNEGKHPIREITGIDGDLPRHWSKRRNQIELRRAVLSASFQERHGRPPTTKEAGELGQQATLETRQAKHEPRSLAEQRNAWRAEAITVLGSEIALRSYLRAALHPSRMRGERGVRLTDRRVQRIAEEVVFGQRGPDGRRVGGVQSQRAVWQENHIRAEAERRVRAANIRRVDVDRAVDEVVQAALGPGLSLPLDTHEPAAGADTPALLRRTDGSSVYTVAGARLYTSTAVVQAEQAILAAAAQRGGRTLTEAQVDVALLESVANTVPLNPGQVQLVRELATSGARVQLALAPAGTGKTTAMRVLASAWTASGGNTIGLAPSAAAAAVLREEIGAKTDTLAKLIVDLSQSAATDPHRFDGSRTWLNVPFAERAEAKKAGAHFDPATKSWFAPGGDAQVADGAALARWRDWLTTVGPNTLVVVDEAGMACTPDLDKTIAFVLARGGSVRLVGDDQQLAAIGAGGVLRDIAARDGAVTLSQVMRFTHPAGHPAAGTPNHAEGAASLALRNGDPAALGYYLDQQRVHVGDLTTCADDAYDAWRTDRAAGRDAIMLAPTRDLVAQLNTRARADRLADVEANGIAVDAATETTVQLADGLTCSAGDTIISRQNDRTIPVSTTDWVKNGDRWTVDAVVESGALQVTHLRTKRHITLPAAYVTDNVELGYACTIHAAQGVTADACHTVATGEESRQLFYVAMTRGRGGNHVYLTTAGDGDPHAVITREALLPPTAVDMLTRILARDEAPVSATSTARDLTDPNHTLHHSADLYFDALTTAAAVTLGPDRMAAIDRAADAAVPHLTDLIAYPALRVHLALCTVAGGDPDELLARAVAESNNGGRTLTDARDAAAVLDWRLSFSTGTDHELAVGGPLPWLPTIPEALQRDPQWGAYLTTATDDVRAQAAAIRDQATSWTPTEAPAWAGPLIDINNDEATAHDRDLVGDLAVWRAATGVEPDDWRHTGDRQLPAAEARSQRALEQRISRVLGDSHASAATWQPLADSIDTRLARDPYWPILATQLAAAHRAGIDITALTRVVAGTGPLPDEQPAAALWWRLARHLSPAATSASASSVNDTLRPDWTPALVDMFGAELAARITGDPGWPGLVAALTHGVTPRGETPAWDAVALLDAAHDLIRGAQPDDAPLRPGELTTALTWRISMLTDPDPFAAAAARSTPAAHSDGDSSSDGDAQMWPDAVPVLDEEWLASLGEPESEPEPDDGDVPPPEDRDEPPADLNSARPEDLAAGVVWVADGGDTDFSRGAINRHPTSAEVPRERVVALNRAAADFYADAYPDSWAAGYVTYRLGLAPATVARHGDAQASLADYSLGYAPDGWTSLVDHLRTTSDATDRELVAAGLASYAKTGRLIDRFRDRLVFPVTAPAADASVDQQPEVHGFIARRNPDHDPAPGAETDPKHGPKYLNTPETDLFHKGHELFGLAETRTLQAAGATPVHVEGPMDALAVTLAGGGRYIGLAPMGSALTDVQADRIVAAGNSADSASTPVEGKSPQGGIIVATDTDQAGVDAAHHAYWQLVLRGESPRRLTLAGAKDPAELLHDQGAPALRDSLDATPSLAGALVTAVIDGYADRLDTVEGRVAAARRSAEILAALPPDQWAPHLARLVQRTGVVVDTVTSEVFDAHDEWLSRPGEFAAQQSNRRLPAPATPTPTSRWAQLAERINPRLTGDASWPALARAIDRAAATGYDVEAQLPTLANRRALPNEHPVRSLEYRLLDAHPAAADPTHSGLTLGQTRAAEVDAAARLAADGPHQTTPTPKRPHEPATAPRPAVTSAPSSAPDRSREHSPRR